MASSKTKKVIWGFVILSCLAGGGAMYYSQNQTKEQAKKQEVVSASIGTIEDSVTAQGTLEPKDYVDVGAQVSGQLKKLYVDIGYMVKQGDLLAELDPQVYETVLKGDQAKLASLQAQLEQQKAQTEYDRLQYARAAKLIASGAISKGDLEEKDKALKVAEATIKSLEAQIAEVQASLDKDQVNLSYTKIYAPMDGVVSDKSAREGQTLNANQTTPTIVQIANLNTMTIRAEIAEADVMRLKPDMDSTFTTMGEQEHKWKGKIRQILPTPEVVNDVVLYNALIDVENVDGQLMNGMSTQVSFVVARAENAVQLPTRALGYHLVDKDSDKGKVYRVSVVTSQGPQDREVLVGLMTRSSVQVLDGLMQGDQVIVTGTSGQELKDSKKGKDMGPPGMGARL
ncbi:MAG: efflux RND transporter periplasmic adaptor subunit [Alphaproteobacteria bacterium]|nr:efflux RND transporter periplasmic adaptor subunit [Alphaproteobacteria bacterium]